MPKRKIVDSRTAIDDWMILTRVQNNASVAILLVPLKQERSPHLFGRYALKRLPQDLAPFTYYKIEVAPASTGLIPQLVAMKINL
jgi:hypothetical protein